MIRGQIVTFGVDRSSVYYSKQTPASQNKHKYFSRLNKKNAEWHNCTDVFFSKWCHPAYASIDAHGHLLKLKV
jgi:hypothetical protein